MANVLIVDDNEEIAECLECLLKLEGHDVRVASHGEHGLLALTSRLPDLVILDVDMPILDGPGMAYRMFVDDCGREKIPIVLASAELRLPEIAARVGTPYYLGKPFDPTELMTLVNRALAEGTPPRPALAGFSP
jgi:CheY-like chemotaxis protein